MDLNLFYLLTRSLLVLISLSCIFIVAEIYIHAYTVCMSKKNILLVWGHLRNRMKLAKGRMRVGRLAWIWTWLNQISWYDATECCYQIAFLRGKQLNKKINSKECLYNACHAACQIPSSSLTLYNARRRKMGNLCLIKYTWNSSTTCQSFTFNSY